MVVSVYEERGIVIGERKILLRQLEQKFGMLPENVLNRIKQIEDVDELDRLLSLVLTAQSIEEMGF